MWRISYENSWYFKTVEVSKLCLNSFPWQVTFTASCWFGQHHSVDHIDIYISSHLKSHFSCVDSFIFMSVAYEIIAYKCIFQISENSKNAQNFRKTFFSKLPKFLKINSNQTYRGSENVRLTQEMHLHMLKYAIWYL